MALSRAVKQEEFLDVVADFGLFEGVDGEALERLGAIARCHDYPQGNVLYYRGDAHADVALVISGKVKIVLTSDDGREVIIDIVGAGHLLGLVAALDGGGQPSHAITATDARLAKIRSREFMNWVRGEEAVWERLIAEVGLSVRHAYQQIGAHALLSAKERLLLTLIEIAEREGRPDAGAEQIVFTRPTHEELARRIGSSREVVTRLLSDLLASDLLWGEGRVLRVPASALVLGED